jgi:aldose 1-epimerase
MTTTHVPPSGRQIELRLGGQRAWVVEQSGGLRQYSVNDVDLLDGYEESERCTDARGQVLVPWPNRLEGGAYTFGGATHQLALTEPDKHNAIHGLARWAPWSARDRDATAVTMEHDILAQDGYPYTLHVSVRYSLTETGLTVTTTATNTGRDTAPYGAGMHPYLRLGLERIDDLELRAPGRRLMRTDDRGIPTGAVDVEGTPYDFREARRIGATELDTGYTDLARDADGRAWVDLVAPTGLKAQVWLNERYRYMMLFSGDSLPEPGRRRTGLGIEPMTCAPNAFRTGDGLISLHPGASVAAEWGITPRVRSAAVNTSTRPSSSQA